MYFMAVKTHKKGDEYPTVGMWSSLFGLVSNAVTVEKFEYNTHIAPPQEKFIHNQKRYCPKERLHPGKHGWDRLVEWKGGDDKGVRMIVSLYKYEFCSLGTCWCQVEANAMNRTVQFATPEVFKRWFELNKSGQNVNKMPWISVPESAFSGELFQLPTSLAVRARALFWNLQRLARKHKPT